VSEFTFSALTPTAYLDRSAYVHATATALAVVDGDLRLTYSQFADRSRRLAGALRARGVDRGDRVAALCVNSHVMLELHYGVPYAGAVLVPINIRLSIEEIAYILRHSGAKVLVCTADLATAARAAASHLDVSVVVADGETGEYERMLATATPVALACEDERGLIAVGYTSGTTGYPKGVMHHHRGAYLQALAMAFQTQLTQESNYLWTLPQFHCNGWCFTWAVTAAGGTHVCLPTIDVARIWRVIDEHGITHLSAAPTVLTMIADGSGAQADRSDRPLIQVQTGGAPPSPSLLARLSRLGFDVTHLYGLTETFGPIAINDWKLEWDGLPDDERSALQARQGVGNLIADRLRVVDADGVDVAANGQSVGEIVCRGNDVMLGYYNDEAATEAATIAGWLRTGDLGVVHPDGYVEIRDRSKDIIISGGENIASVEVERVLDSHVAVLESAVVGEADPKWGEVVVAFVSLRAGASASSDELIAYARDRLAHFKTPRRVVFGELPKTSTGKIQKNRLREALKASG
jgi:fatty-acyl-CoA synthase